MQRLIRSHYINSKKRINDTLCIFRCIAASKYIKSTTTDFTKKLPKEFYASIEKLTQKCFRKWCRHKNASAINFAGLNFADFTELATFFSVNINTFSFNDENNRFIPSFETEPSDVVNVNILVHDNHCMLIKDVRKIKGFF